MDLLLFAPLFLKVDFDLLFLKVDFDLLFLKVDFAPLFLKVDFLLPPLSKFLGELNVYSCKSIVGNGPSICNWANVGPNSLKPITLYNIKP